MIIRALASSVTAFLLATATQTLAAAPARTAAPAHPSAILSDGPAGSRPEVPPGGCVQACPLDTAPCDSWLYKHADGRCSLPD